MIGNNVYSSCIRSLFSSPSAIVTYLSCHLQIDCIFSIVYGNFRLPSTEKTCELAFQGYILPFFVFTGYMNSLLNPIIYAQFNRDFRLPFIYILQCHCTSINERMRTEMFAHDFGLPRGGHSGCTSPSGGAGGGRPRSRPRPLPHRNLYSRVSAADPALLVPGTQKPLTVPPPNPVNALAPSQPLQVNVDEVPKQKEDSASPELLETPVLQRQPHGD